MKYILLFLLIPLFTRADDTSYIQALLTAGAGGTVMLTPGTYHTSSSLVVPAHTVFQLAGSFIVTSQVSGSAIKVNDHSTVTGGTLQGPWDYTTPGNTGTSGIQVLGSNVSITHLRILQYSTYGVICVQAYSNLAIQYCDFSKIGYIVFYFDPEADGTSGGSFDFNTVDNSMISAVTIQQLAVGIRASTRIATDSTSGWSVTHNIIKMPLNPSHVAAECIEVRLMKNSLIEYNTFTQGSIGVSVAQSRGIIVGYNQTTNSGHEGIEFADSHDCSASFNKITGSSDVGVLIDGIFDKSHRIVLSYDTISGTVNSAIHCFTGTHNFTFNYCQITVAPSGSQMYGIYMQGADTLTVNHTVINGHGVTGTVGYYDALAPGNIIINSGAILGCTSAVKAYNTNTGAVVNNIVGTNVILTGTITQFASFFTNGAHYGPNIRFTASSFVFNSLSPVTYGMGDFDAGATSSVPITYTTDNSAIATIVSGKVHITGTGTVTITAATSDTTADQSLVVNKKAVTITADDKEKHVGSVNPALTAHYSAFAYSETSAILVTPPTITTTALTGSGAGTYPITPSAASATNYTFSYTNGTLTVGNYTHGPILHIKAKHL